MNEYLQQYITVIGEQYIQKKEKFEEFWFKYISCDPKYINLK